MLPFFLRSIKIINISTTSYRINAEFLQTKVRIKCVLKYVKKTVTQQSYMHLLEYVYRRLRRIL